jgi:hypothetical protein
MNVVQSNEPWLDAVPADWTSSRISPHRPEISGYVGPFCGGTFTELVEKEKKVNQDVRPGISARSPAEAPKKMKK